MSANVAGMRTSPSNGAGGEEAGLTVEGGSLQERSEAQLLRDHDILWLRAGNAGAMTLSGTNSWVVGREPAWVVDPGPRLDDHIASLLEAIDARGGLGGIALTHDHQDHCEAVPALTARYQAPVAAGRGEVDILFKEGAHVGPFEALATPGHAVGHFALIADGACFTGDAVLGEGSVFISPSRGAMAGYLRALTRLGLRDDFSVLCPGHGPVVDDPQAKLDQYISHRLDRERRVLNALSGGKRSVDELLDEVWADAPAHLRPAATVTLAAHLDKLDDEGRLPEGVERPTLRF